MKYVAAYLLAHLGAVVGEDGGGNPSPPCKDDVRRILDSVGDEVDEGRLDLLFRQLEGKDFVELLAAGREMIAYAPSGAVAVPAASTAALEVKAEEKEEDVKDEDSDGEDIVFCDIFG